MRVHEDQFNQVLRPYFSFLQGDQIKDEAALNSFFERFAHDEGLVSLMRAAHADFNELMTTLEQLLVSPETLAQAHHCYLVRLFGAFFARPLATSILTNWDSAAILALFAQRQQLSEKYTLLGAMEHKIPGFTLEQVSRLLIQLLGFKLTTKYQLPYRRVLDLEPDQTTALNVINGGVLKYLRLVAPNPKIWGELSQSQLLNNAAKQAVESKTTTATVQFNILRAILAHVSNQKIYFSPQGQQFVNKVPAGTWVQDYFVTMKLCDLVNTQKADLVKANLTEGNLKLLSDTNLNKFYRHGMGLALSCGGELPIVATPAYADLDTILGESKLILCAIKSFSTAIASNTKKLKLELAWNYEPLWPYRHQLVIAAREQ